jgi:hypothetical protein
MLGANIHSRHANIHYVIHNRAVQSIKESIEHGSTFSDVYDNAVSKWR